MLDQHAGGDASPAHLIDLHRRSRTHVLLLGGTPKQRLAAAFAFHYRSLCNDGPFIRLDGACCGGQLERALRAGLSNGARLRRSSLLRFCARGTLFIDRVDQLCLKTQRLMRSFIDRCADRGLAITWSGRIVAGSSIDLARSVAEGRFLSELYDDLDKIRIRLPRRSRLTGLGDTFREGPT